MIQIKPFGHQILIETIKDKRVLNSSDTEYGTVISIGDDVKYIKEGDVIGYTPWGFNDLTIQDGTPDGKTYRFIPEDSRFILAKLNLS